MSWDVAKRLAGESSKAAGRGEQQSGARATSNFTGYHIKYKRILLEEGYYVPEGVFDAAPVDL